MGKRFLLIMTIAALLSGCGTIDKGKAQTVRIVWKTPTLRYGDMAFMRTYNSTVELELYSVSNPLSKLTVTPTQVCRDALACVSSKHFVAKYLHASYPADTLYRIVRFEPIMQGQHLRQTHEGFVQKVTRPNVYDIRYRVFNGQVRFHDTINHITILIKIQGRDR